MDFKEANSFCYGRFAYNRARSAAVTDTLTVERYPALSDLVEYTLAMCYVLLESLNPSGPRLAVKAAKRLLTGVANNRCSTAEGERQKLLTQQKVQSKVPYGDPTNRAC